VCGIAGILRVDGGLVERDPLERMVDALAHRGPDGSGIHIDKAIGLGHRRLSILDPTPAGAQPMLRGRNALVHNGEVYNYVELIAELRDHGERIDTGTDTEVMLAAYRVWGVDAVSRFNGMFAFALWDAEKQRLLLARDRMGVKPLYLRRTGRSLAFASELSAFVAGRTIEPGDRWTPEPHLGAVHDFLARGWTEHSTATFLDGVTALPAAHLLIVEPGTERLVRYWGPPQLSDDARPVVRGTDENRDERLVEEFRATFDSSVRLRLRSDVPIGTCLSGGLDSSSIVTTVAELSGGGGEVHEQVPRLGFHARFPEHGIDESPFAELVARQAGIRLVYTTPTGHPLLSAVLPVLRAQGEPYGGGSTDAQYAVMAAAHEERIKVLLDGQGADELLGGYLSYLGLRSAGLLFSGSPIGAIGELSAQARRGPYSAGGAVWAAVNSGLPRGMLEAIRDRSRGVFGIQCAAPLRHESASQKTRREPGTFLASRLWHALSTRALPTLLRYEDRNSMAFGIEARVPFLDVRLVELAVRLPDRLRIDRGTTKVVLRRAMKGRLPAAVAARRDKLGFAAPQQAWLADGRAQVVALLRGGQVVQRGWVAPREVERVLAQKLSGGRETDQLWRLFVLEAWLRMLWPDAGGAVGRATWDAGLAGEARSPRMTATTTVVEAGDGSPARHRADMR
jgi:asparagine synthase (glutamine-hydrolysing)